MPRTDIDYSKTSFYRIVCRDLNVKACYVGHTTDFRRRKSEHKRKSKERILNGPNSMMYYFVGRNGGWDNFEMVLIKTQACEGSLDAHRIRLEYMNEFKAELHGPMRPIPVFEYEESAISTIPEQQPSKQTAPPKKVKKEKKTEAVEIVAVSTRVDEPRQSRALSTRVDELPKQPKPTKPSEPPTVLAALIEGRPDMTEVPLERRPPGWEKHAYLCVLCNCYVHKYHELRHYGTPKHKKALAARDNLIENLENADTNPPDTENKIEEPRQSRALSKQVDEPHT